MPTFDGMSADGDPRTRGGDGPPFEQERLAALHGYAILDSDREQVYDDIVRLAAQICGTPIAAISFVDEERQWFKAEVGLGVRETSRDLSFCAHALLTPEQTMVVPDATADERFAGNALVTGDPGIRFYAGAPMVAADGTALGSLCAIDVKPRVLEPGQLEALQALSRQVVALLEARSTLRQLAAETRERERAQAEAAVAVERFRLVFESRRSRWPSPTPPACSPM